MCRTSVKATESTFDYTTPTIDVLSAVAAKVFGNSAILPLRGLSMMSGADDPGPMIAFDDQRD